MIRVLRRFVVAPADDTLVEQIIMYVRWGLVFSYPTFVALGAIDTPLPWAAFTTAFICVYGGFFQWNYAHGGSWGWFSRVQPFVDTLSVWFAYASQSDISHPLWVVFLVGMPAGAAVLGPRMAALLVACVIVAFTSAAAIIHSAQGGSLLEIAMMTSFLAAIAGYVAATGRGEQLMRTRIDALARSDSLTGIANRLRLREVLDARKKPLSGAILMIDLDNFKRWNDAHGHVAGDQLLIDVARLLTENLREGDLVFRYGGDEFVALLPGCEFANAIAIAEQVRGTVAEELGATLSVGVGPYASAQPMDEQLSVADAALYRAKQAGRNRVAAALVTPAAPARPERSGAA